VAKNPSEQEENLGKEKKKSFYHFDEARNGQIWNTLQKAQRSVSPTVTDSW